MAVLDFVQVAPSGNGGNNTIYAATLGAAGTSGTITTGSDMIIRIAASGDITVRFGTTTNLTPATATDIYVPAKTPYIIDMGHTNNAISIFSIAAATVITVNQVSKN